MTKRRHYRNVMYDTCTNLIFLSVQVADEDMELFTFKNRRGLGD